MPQAVGVPDLVIVALYLAAMLGLGLHLGRRIGSFREYFVVSGRLTAPLLVCTLVSTYYGLDVLFGVSEVAYREGLVSFYVYSRPYYLFILIAALVVARRLKEHDFLSLPDVAAEFYGRPAQAACAVASFLYSLPILAVMGLGILMDVLFDVPLAWGVAGGAAFSLAYTVLGGLVADSITDTVQFTLMCVTLGVAAWLGLDRVGGFETLARELPESFFSATGGYPLPILLVFAVTATSALVDPGFYQRIFAARSYRAVAVAMGIGVVLWAAFDWVTAILGMVARVGDFDVGEPRYALLEATVEILPAGLLGLFLAGVVATAMSTIDTYLLISGGNLSYDLWRPGRREPPDDRTLLRATRVAMVVSAALTVGLALFFRTVVSAWVFMSSLLVCTALVPILAGLYLPAPHPREAGNAAAVTGLVSASAFYALVHAFGSYDPEWATTAVTLSVGQTSVQVWQEHAVLVGLPLSALAYVAGHAYGRGRKRPGRSR